ncbi:hypothetical protein B566_EDAN004676 [Ephemera danica]|nr:hypothetical protein B566_EDAN004676 [Ephemera danica]
MSSARGGSAGSMDNALTYLYNSENLEINVEAMEVETPKEVVMQQIEDVRKDFAEVKKLIPIQKNPQSAQQKLTNLIFRLDDISTTDDEETQAMLTLLAEIQECLKKVQNKVESSDESDFEAVTVGGQGAPFVQTRNLRGSAKSVSVPESGDPNKKLAGQDSSVNNSSGIPAVSHSLTQPDDATSLYTTGNMDSFELEADSDQLNSKVTEVFQSQENVPATSKDYTRDCLMQVGDSPIVEEGQDSVLQLLLQDAQGKFYLNKEALGTILSGVKDRKLVIVSIVGAFRRGKSFLLNFLLRYLKAGVSGLLWKV